MNELVKLAVVALIAGLVGGFAAGLVGSNQFGAGTRFPNGISADTTSPTTGQVRGTTLTITGASTLGTSGTSLNGIVAGSCTVWSSSATIAASSSQQVECQSATNGTLSTALSGVTTDALCSLAAPTGASALSMGLVINGLVASSTDAGTITARVSNHTGGTFTWSSAASSSWEYICVDPA